MDKYKIDSHKLLYHVPRVNDWLNKKNIYPIYMEASLFGGCNHRCVFCALDFMEYKPRYLNTEIFKERITEMGKLGLKSIMYAGEGEPFLHKHVVEISNHTKKSGIDVAFTTNAVMMTPEKSEQILENVEWIKVSINGATPGTYSKIHKCREEDFNNVIRNMSFAAELRKSKGYRCTLGMQMILIPENSSEVTILAKIARDIGMDYLVIKPYSQHPLSKTVEFKKIKYEEYLHLQEELENINSDKFNVIFRLNPMNKWDAQIKKYDKCLSLPFWSYIDSGGNVWGCSMFLNDERFLYGNINENTFQQIWEGEKRARSMEWFKDFDSNKCRINCRMDEINNYLWELLNPRDHVNFI